MAGCQYEIKRTLCGFQTPGDTRQVARESVFTAPARLIPRRSRGKPFDDADAAAEEAWTCRPWGTFFLGSASSGNLSRSMIVTRSSGPQTRAARVRRCCRRSRRHVGRALSPGGTSCGHELGSAALGRLFLQQPAGFAKVGGVVPLVEASQPPASLVIASALPGPFKRRRLLIARSSRDLDCRADAVGGLDEHCSASCLRPGGRGVRLAAVTVALRQRSW